MIPHVHAGCLLIVVGGRLVNATPRGRLRRRAGVRFEHRATRPGELRGVLPQARDDPFGIGHLLAAKPEHVGRTSHLLFKGSPIFLGKSRSLNSDTAGKRDRKTQGNSVCSHVRSFLVDAQVPQAKLHRVTLENKCGLERFARDNKL